MVLHNVYETLTHYNDATGEVEALLAKDWSVNETGDVWVFNLRDDVTFHDGTPMTAANVVKSINKTINSAANTIGREVGKQIVRGLFDTFLR